MKQNKAKPKQKQKISKKSLAFIIVALFGLSAIYLVDASYIRDEIVATFFQPSAEIVELKDRLALTRSGSRILLASEPELEDRDAFNENCDSRDPNISVLGCYASGKIHIYNIENPELVGINENTLAHEMLHAVWARLGSSEKQKLETEINKVYEARREDLDDRLKNYPEEDWIDEMHSIIGSELYIVEDCSDKLPAACVEVSDSDILNDHYAKYFTDRSIILTFFNNYDSKFEALKKEAEDTREQIDTLAAELDQLNAEYVRRTDELNAKIDDFNRRANNGYFSSESAFYSERSKLVAENDAVDAMYYESVDKTAAYNALIEKYNANVIRANDLSESINSNVAPPEASEI
jgi:hypothetical protein